VTTGAGFGDVFMVKPHIGHARGGVTLFAARIGINVARMFAHRQNAIVATGALSRCTFEHTTHMTGLTINGEMSATERKTGIPVIEFFFDFPLHHARREPQKQQY